MFADEAFLNQLINNQRAAVKYYRVLAIAIFVLGAIVIILALAWPGQSIGEKIKILLAIGGGVVSSLSTFQLKEIWNRKDRIAVLEAVKNQVGSLQEKSADQAELTRVEEMLSQLVGKIMG